METRDPKELEELAGEVQRLRAEVSFLKSEINRKDNAWIKSWQELQARFNEKVAEVRLLREIVEKLEMPKKELVYE